MDHDDEISIKKIKLMTPYVHLNKAFIINSVPTIFSCFNNSESADVKVILGSSDQNPEGDDKDSTILYLHKVILSSGSPMFDAWLKNCQKSDDGYLILRIPENYPWMFDFFRYFYTGQFSMTTDNIVDIYIVADKYLMESMKTVCEEHLRECLKIKLEKNSTCNHLKSVLSFSQNAETDDLFRTGSNYNRDVTKNRTFLTNPNIFNPASSSTNLNNCTFGNKFLFETSQSINMLTRSESDYNFLTNRSNIFNNKFDVPVNSKSIFSKSERYPDFDSTNKFQLFCEKCLSGPLTVTKMLSFDALIPLSRISNSKSDLKKLAFYNIIIQLVEEIRIENYSNFINLPFDILVELLENDNFFSPEIQLFCGIKHWLIKSQKLTSSSSSTTDDSSSINSDDISPADILIKLIRFPLMSVDELYDVESSARTSKLFTQSLLESLIHQALRYIVYRGVQKAKLEETWSGSSFKPRIPTDIVKHI